ncbi:hypothetical protein [Bifidobacterium fermentum]|uniref:Uncharacterized protein n=1 Tax=Bifidobacterium fermentum TaxID=3059035 RepID=A0AB39UK93_9BIFI
MSAAPWPAVITDRQHRQAAQTSSTDKQHRQASTRVANARSESANQWPTNGQPMACDRTLHSIPCIPFLALHAAQVMSV